MHPSGFGSRYAKASDMKRTVAGAIERGVNQLAQADEQVLQVQEEVTAAACRKGGRWNSV